MANQGQWYRSLSMPSLLFLAVCLLLCLFFSIKAIEHLHEYVIAQAELRQVQEQRDWLRGREEKLQEARQNIESEKERAAREEGLVAHPDETLVLPRIVPETGVSEEADQTKPLAVLPPWQQWWALFFGPTPQKEIPGRPLR